MHGAVKVFSVILLFSLPTVMYGDYSLLWQLVANRLTPFQIAYFRAGHAHAGVLLVLALAVLDLVDRAGPAQSTEWMIGGLLVAGVLAQSGGMFVHMAIGEPGRWSPGNTLTTTGGLLLAAALVTAAIAVIAS